MNFKSGDRVRIIPSEADGFLNPLRKYGRENRGAVVEDMTANGAFIRFDAKRGTNYGPNFKFFISKRYIEHEPA